MFTGYPVSRHQDLDPGPSYLTTTNVVVCASITIAASSKVFDLLNIYETEKESPNPKLISQFFYKQHKTAIEFHRPTSSPDSRRSTSTSTDSSKASLLNCKDPGCSHPMPEKVSKAKKGRTSSRFRKAIHPAVQQAPSRR
ncbi:Hypothetical_protein [Hexamita inflata]|uniref:Hypothetical_protein n=1 Tax=Hexamita inflata TaxID=28002 RepID=A0AA86NBT2_9EUKA|nr:Hypothetical protein HINF_LOCUS4467 [Hexamita inflata]